MKRFLLIFILSSSSLSAQVVFNRNYDVVKAMAIEKDQLILLDFWAIWCGPCRTMDKELWSTTEVTESSENFIPFKVDFDVERRLATKYNANSIPKVILVTADGEVVWERVGFGGPEPYLEILNQVPTSLNGLNRMLVEDYDKDDANKLMQIAEVYQSVGMAMNNELGEEFLTISDSYFKKASKKTDNESLIAIAEINQLFNDALKGRVNKVLKKLDKVDIKSDDSQAQEFKNYVAAYCYKCEGDKANYEKEKSEIQNKDYITKLESLNIPE